MQIIVKMPSEMEPVDWFWICCERGGQWLMHNGICIEMQPSKQIQLLAPLSGSLAAVVVWCGW